MGSGIFVPTLFNITTSVAENLIISSENPAYKVSIKGGPWTPPQYSQPALTILTVPATSSSSTAQPTASDINYVFDAVFRLMHQRRITKTQHPVLTGANISDHAYVQPARLVLEIGMSDAMSSFTSGVWVGASTKSVSAWQILKSLYLSRTLLTITTRLDTYYNMLILDMVSPDDNKTKHALRGTITFEEIISAVVSSINPSSSSTRPQTTSNTSGGVIQSVNPNGSQVGQYSIPSTSYPSVSTYPQIPGAGVVSSNNLGQVPSIPVL